MYQRTYFTASPFKAILFTLFLIFILSSCEKKLENETFGVLSGDVFPKTEKDLIAAVNAMYTGMVEKDGYSAGWGAAQGSFRVQASQTTDERYVTGMTVPPG